MNVLAFDTSSEILAVGLVGEGLKIAVAVEGIRHAETLMPTVDDCLRREGLRPRDLDLVGCAIGPGSFMGLRIGLATAKGLSLALGLPWVGVPTLDAMALPFAARAGAVVPVLDARKNRVYSAVYRAGRLSSRYLDCGGDELLALLVGEDAVSFVGPYASFFEDLCLERPGFSVEEDKPEERALAVAELALEAFRAHGPSPEDAVPLYLREPEIG